MSPISKSGDTANHTHEYSRTEIPDGLEDYLSPRSYRWTSFLGNTFGIGQTDWVKVFEEVDRRRIVFGLHKNRLEIERASHEIAAVDIFVEKAQLYLEQKSRQSGTWALVCVTGLAAIIALDLYYLTSRATIPQFLDAMVDRRGAPAFGYLFAMWVLRGSAISVLSGAAIYFLASLTRAFLHEATVLWNRRHSLRLGRLFIYLKFASIDDDDILKQMRKSLRIEDIEKAFGWNLETASAFRDIKPELMAIKSVYGDPTRLIEALAKLRTSKKKENEEAI